MAEIYLALGSNLGNRARAIHTALERLAAFAHVQATSFLYETPPAYVVDQPKFLNAVCRIESALAPHDLLAAVKEVERAVGRRPTFRYGPREIDLDILLYDDLALHSDDLTIPHPRLAERAFVLEPLCDLNPDLRHPVLGQSVRALWQALGAKPLPKVMPVGEQLWEWSRKTYIVGIINMTPDSFSGDGLMQYGGRAIEMAVAQAQRFVEAGADCVDVGGQSTRPGHELISPEEEMARVVPAVEAISEQVQVPVSIDTFRAEVASAALQAVKQNAPLLLNDVWGLRFDPALAAVAAQAYAPLLVMDNRVQPADPAYAARVQAERYGPSSGDLILDIRQQLAEAAAHAQAAGLPRWLVMVDPGIGFGKTTEQHLALLRRLGELCAWGYPVLIGPSRKRFIGKVLGDLPVEERLEGTLAASVLAVERGANVLRVHDVRAAVRAVRFAEAVLHSTG
jgi:dihydropteroate synthase/2-amino-4-hydroxy-6-hydroxymethyldihydropteridine diphosphokinase